MLRELWTAGCCRHGFLDGGKRRRRRWTLRRRLKTSASADVEGAALTVEVCYPSRDRVRPVQLHYRHSELTAEAAQRRAQTEILPEMNLFEASKAIYSGPLAASVLGFVVVGVVVFSSFRKVLQGWFDVISFWLFRFVDDVVFYAARLFDSVEPTLRKRGSGDSKPVSGDSAQAAVLTPLMREDAPEADLATSYLELSALEKGKEETETLHSRGCGATLSLWRCLEDATVVEPEEVDWKTFANPKDAASEAKISSDDAAVREQTLQVVATEPSRLPVRPLEEKVRPEDCSDSAVARAGEAATQSVEDEAFDFEHAISTETESTDRTWEEGSAVVGSESVRGLLSRAVAQENRKRSGQNATTPAKPTHTSRERAGGDVDSGGSVMGKESMTNRVLFHAILQETRRQSKMNYHLAECVDDLGDATPTTPAKQTKEKNALESRMTGIENMLSSGTVEETTEEDEKEIAEAADTAASSLMATSEKREEDPTEPPKPNQHHQSEAASLYGGALAGSSFSSSTPEKEIKQSAFQGTAISPITSNKTRPSSELRPLMSAEEDGHDDHLAADADVGVKALMTIADKNDGLMIHPTGPPGRLRKHVDQLKKALMHCCAQPEASEDEISAIVKELIDTRPLHRLTEAQSAMFLWGTWCVVRTTDAFVVNLEKLAEKANVLGNIRLQLRVDGESLTACGFVRVESASFKNQDGGASAAEIGTSAEKSIRIVGVESGDRVEIHLPQIFATVDLTNSYVPDRVSVLTVEFDVSRWKRVLAPVTADVVSKSGALLRLAEGLLPEALSKALHARAEELLRVAYLDHELCVCKTTEAMYILEKQGS